MPPARKDLARQALLKADEVRDRYDIEPEWAVNVFDLCGERLDPIVLVRFSDVPSMEGFYLRQEKPEIWLGERPLGRRMFNCAHELGHHLFGHGSTLDNLSAESASGRSFEPDEFLVDTFAGYLLMPRIAVMYAFNQRGWKAEDAEPEQFFVVSCSLGVGFETLVSHCFFSLNLIGESGYRNLIKVALPTIRRSMLGEHAPGRLLVVDAHHTRCRTPTPRSARASCSLLARRPRTTRWRTPWTPFAGGSLRRASRASRGSTRQIGDGPSSCGL